MVQSQVCIWRDGVPLFLLLSADLLPAHTDTGTMSLLNI